MHEAQSNLKAHLLGGEQIIEPPRVDAIDYIDAYALVIIHQIQTFDQIHD